MPKPEVVSANPDNGWGDHRRSRLLSRRCHSRSSVPLISGHSTAVVDSFAHIPLQVENSAKRERPELTEEELLIASPVLMGFSLADKLWCEYPFTLVLD